MKKPIFASLFLCLPLFLQLAGVFSAPIYSPVEDIAINCGSPGSSLNLNDNRNWAGDIKSKYTPSETDQAVRETPTSSAMAVPYATARLSRSEFSYKFSLTAGQKFVRLYFNPVSYGADFNRSNSFFSVKAGVFTLLHDFNASVTADASGVDTLTKEFCLNIDEEQSLKIIFTPSKAIPDAYAFINGIEIVSMPTNHYYSENQDSSPNYIGNQNTYPIENSTAMEMVYRINVGGRAISFNQDTGMYRHWDDMVEEERRYLEDLSNRLSFRTQNVTIELKFVKIKNYSAPKEVYETGRSMGNNKTITKSYNLTWQFPVDPNFDYLVRLHFCEFKSLVNQTNYRRFLIYVANQTAETNADIIKWTGGEGNGKPVYKDYVVFMPARGDQKKVNLSLALQANPLDYLTIYNDALLNGIEIFKLSETNGNLAGPNPDPPPPKRRLQSSLKPRKKPDSVLGIVAGTVSSVLVLGSVIGVCLFRRRRAKEFTARFSASGCREFSLSEIKSATKRFNKRSIIGVGGFGHVYKGNIQGLATPVAIKRLKPESQQGEIEFQTEIEMLSTLRHQHLVSLIGYCRDKGEMILVYEFMENGTLYDHLINPKPDRNPPNLPWEQRLKICIGAARGLHYLHTGAANGTIIHRDVKSTNILLDQKWVAKVADFGLSKMGTITMSKTHITTMVKGSIGYLDPEYYLREQLTVKSDVYSFGVVLCEVLCGRPALLRTAVEKKQMSLAEWFKACHRNEKVDQIIDASLKGKIEDACFKKFVEITMSCMHENGSERPTMNDVVEGLEFALQLQESGKGDYLESASKAVNEIELINESDVGSSYGWGDSSNTKDSRVTNTSSNQSLITNESIRGMSGTVFSEIKDPSAR